MPQTQDTSTSWSQRLPTFHGLSTANTSTLLRPFSRFSISSLFRSSAPSLPSTTLIAPLTSDIDGLVSSRDAIKILLALKDFTAQLREAVLHHKLERGAEEVISRVEKLADAYLGGVYLASKQVWPDDDRQNDKTAVESLRSAVRDSLQGFFLAYQILVEEDRSTTNFDKHLLGLIFPSEETKYHHLSPLFFHPRKLVASLQTAPTRPIAGTKLKSAQSPTSPKLQDPSDDEVLFVLELLKILSDGLDQVDILPGPVMAKNKREREEDNRRPLRVGMEVNVLRCDLLLSMTNKQMAQVKARALANGTGEEVENKDGEGQVASEVTAEDKEEDVKPRLSQESDRSIAKQGIESLHELAEPDALAGIKWEDQAERSLIECLSAAKKLVEEGRAEVMTAQIDAVDWLGEVGIITPDRSTSPSKSKSKSKSPSHGPDASTIEDADEESESDSDSESDESEDELSEVGGPSHPCPLRTLFRLHDRYEEQRLAVWLNLPAAGRGKMGWYMRGEEGRVGSAWDGLGLALIIEYDTETLLSYGLGVDKLDKWVELAAARNTKKIRRKGRKTV